jgi:hypothetical protein
MDYTAWNHIASELQKRFGRAFKIEDDADHDSDDDRLDADDIDNDRDDSGNNGGNSGNGDNGNEPRHVVDELAYLLVEGGSPNGEITREQALQWLLHSERGQALVARMAQHRKRKGNSMNRSEQLRVVVKRAGGIMSLCKSIATSGRSNVTEHELTQLIVDAAKREHPDLSDAQAFARAFGAAGPNGETLRKAVAIAKAVQLEIMPDSTEADQDDSGKATRQMERLVDEQIRRSPETTRSQAWNVAVRENPMLAAAAIRRPTTNKANSFPFPR